MRKKHIFLVTDHMFMPSDSDIGVIEKKTRKIDCIARRIKKACQKYQGEKFIYNSGQGLQKPETSTKLSGKEM